MWVLYILRCSDKTYYTGITKDLKARLRKHANGKGSRYVLTRRPFVLWYTLACPNFNEKTAKKVEAKVKNLSRAKKEAFMRGEGDLYYMICASFAPLCVTDYSTKDEDGSGVLG